ncbi:MAG TPA: hypothetical protein GX399_02415 [Xanthomonadaceae bacterium]|nr:hypothetical protein [Xanthomonadaceae bacterium]
MACIVERSCLCGGRQDVRRLGVRAQGAQFYERRHQRQANRLLVISPMMDARARKMAERLGIEVYGDSTNVESL